MGGYAQYHGAHDKKAQSIEYDVPAHANDVGLIQGDTVQEAIFLAAFLHFVFIEFGDHDRIGGVAIFTLFDSLVGSEDLVHVGVVC